MSSSQGIGSALAAFLSKLMQQVERKSLTGDFGGLAQGAIDLCGALCNSATAEPIPSVLSQSNLMSRIGVYIDANISEPDLSPDRVAVAHHISRRSLYRLFEMEGTTVAGLIRERRLERCRQQLCDPAHKHESICQIGVRFGLPDPAHLSRLFTAAYGDSPREYRRRHLSLVGR
jgi:AraC-like DNA-binding protein